MSAPKADWKPGAAFLSYLAVVVAIWAHDGWKTGLLAAGVFGLIITGVIAAAKS